MQAPSPTLAYCPALHATVLELEGQLYPAGHCEQAVWFSSAYVPDPHGVGDVDVVGQAEPAGHAEHQPTVPSEYVPKGGEED